MANKDYSIRQEQLARFAKAMGHPARIAILQFLAKQETCGLWRFAVSFDAQAEVDSYAIDVDPDTGKIIWTISTTEMPGGEFTLSISVNVKH